MESTSDLQREIAREREAFCELMTHSSHLTTHHESTASCHDRPVLGTRLNPLSQLRTVEPKRKFNDYAVAARPEMFNTFTRSSLGSMTLSESLRVADDQELQNVVASMGTTLQGLTRRECAETKAVKAKDSIRSLMNVHEEASKERRPGMDLTLGRYVSTNSEDIPSHSMSATAGLSDVGVRRGQATEYTYNFTQSKDLDNTVRSHDKTHQKLFVRDEHRKYVEKAVIYKEWPPKGGAPPWPKKSEK